MSYFLILGYRGFFIGIGDVIFGVGFIKVKNNFLEDGYKYWCFELVFKINIVDFKWIMSV